MEEVPLILSLTDKAIRQIALYGPTHPHAESTVVELERHLSSYLEKEAALIVGIKRNTFEFNDQPAFTLEKKDGNYIQEMYVDGVRKLTFLKGIGRQEIVGLALVLSRDVQQYESGEDDTVTLLWKRGFKHIQVDTVDVFAGDLNALLREIYSSRKSESAEEKSFLARFIQDLVSPSAQAVSELRTEEESRLEREFMKEIAADVPYGRFLPVPEEEEKLRDEFVEYSRKDPLRKILPVFAEILEQTRATPAFELLTALYMKQLANLLAEGKIRTALEWLETLREVETLCDADFNDSIAHQLTSELFHDVGSRIAQAAPGTPEDWVSFFKLLGPISADRVCILLKYIAQETVRSAFVSFLKSLPVNASGVFLMHLKASEPLLVRDMVRVLEERATDERVLPALRSAAVFPHPAVRAEVAGAMKNFTGPMRVEILTRILKDPDSASRKVAIQTITSAPAPALLRPLAEEVQSERFLDRDYQEKRSVLHALAKSGGYTSLQFLQQIVDDDAGDPRVQELRMAAMYALAEIDHPAVNAILERLSSGLLEKKEIKEKAKQLIVRRFDREKGRGRG